MKTTIRLGLLCGIFLSLDAVADELRYREEVAGKTTQYTQVSKHAQSTVVQYPDDRFEIRTDPAGATLWVEVSSPRASAKVSVTRDGAALRLTSGATLQELDQQPWHQSPFLLEGFVTSGEKELAFWTLTTSGEVANGGRSVNALKLVARREGTERLNVNGAELETVHVMITVPGFRSLFWKAHYWYRLDGTLVRYEEPRGKKGFVRGELMSQTP